MIRINFANVNNTQKLIETVKHYQQNLSQLTKTASEEGKEAIKKFVVQYIAIPDYFGTVCEKLEISKQFKILVIIASSKGISPYEKIISSDRLNRQGRSLTGLNF